MHSTMFHIGLNILGWPNLGIKYQQSYEQTQFEFSFSFKRNILGRRQFNIKLLKSSVNYSWLRPITFEWFLACYRSVTTIQTFCENKKKHILVMRLQNRSTKFAGSFNKLFFYYSTREFGQSELSNLWGPSLLNFKVRQSGSHVSLSDSIGWKV